MVSTNSGNYLSLVWNKNKQFRFLLKKKLNVVFIPLIVIYFEAKPVN